MEPIATKQKKSICKLMIAVLICGLSHANPALGESGKTACNPPKGELEIDKTVDCGGTETVGIGKEYTGKTKNLEDKDCYCGSKVDDSIDPGAGIQWMIDGTTETAETFTKKAPNAPTTINISLEIDDEATDPSTTDDGGFTHVDDITIDAVIPNSGSNNDPGYSQCPSPNHIAEGNSNYDKGRYKVYDVTGNKSGCAVDFQGLYFNESGYNYTSDGCNFGSAGAGSNNPTRNKLVNSSNTAPYADLFALCGPVNWARETTCSSRGVITWSITSDSSKYFDWGEFNFELTIPNPGGINQSTSLRSWNRAL